MSRPIVLIGSEKDGHIAAVGAALRDRGVEALVLDTLDFPSNPRITLGERLGSITIDGRTVDRPAAVYLRDLYVQPLAVGVDVADEMEQDWRRTLIAFREKSQVLFPLLGRWTEAGAAVYNPLAGDWRQLKVMQLALLEAAGLPVPATIWTNDPVAVRDFADGKRVAYKPVAGGAATKELGPEDLTDERLRALDGAPVTFQELVPGDSYRVYCLDGEVVATIRIASEQLDYRQQEEIVEQSTLPDDVLAQCLRAAEVIGLRWTGIDLKQAADGSLKFLELNSSPMFLGFDARAGTGILDSFVSALTSHT